MEEKARMKLAVRCVQVVFFEAFTTVYFSCPTVDPMGGIIAEYASARFGVTFQTTDISTIPFVVGKDYTLSIGG